MAGINLGFENKLWEMADKLRGNIESSEYKHVVLGLIFLKYVSDGFEEKHKELIIYIDRFNFIVKDIFAMFRKNIEESRNVINMRDSLLPKLMSGEIRIS